MLRAVVEALLVLWVWSIHPKVHVSYSWCGGPMNFRASCSNLGPMGQFDRGSVRSRQVVFVGFVHALLATCFPTTWVSRMQ